ncbi:MAG TPA: hypothetical protein VFE23_17565 [Usitatibacter sp.]|jgi:hypothetical protein|nr:hypothetical protein [Usitatibacter sp.]
MRAGVALLLALAAPAAFALETATWPPPAPVQERMHALQQVIIDKESTAAQREAAREELSGLLKSPAGQERGRTPDEKPVRPARAAIIPFPSVVHPLPPEKPSHLPPSEIAHVEVVLPPKPVVLPGKGTAAIAPAPGFAVDPLTGNVLHAVPGGYVDPKTGQFVPR